jgi:opacity protein-like surface antigen
MPRVCSKLGMLLVMLLLTLSMASSALAQKKKKKAAADTAETSEEAEPEAKEKSTDDLMGEATKGKPKAASDDEKPPAEGAEGGSDAELHSQETPGEATSWERPPEEAEKPKKEVAAVTEQKSGDGRPWMAGLIVGYGLKTDSDTGTLASAADPYGLTAGLRGGYTLDFNLYVGIFFAYYLGSTAEGSQARVSTGSSSSNASSMQFGAEAGYDFWIGTVILRPSLQLGGQIAFTAREGDTRSTSDFIAGPGLGLIVPMDGWYLGGEVRPVLPFANAPVMVLLGFHIGLRFQ